MIRIKRSNLFIHAFGLFAFLCLPLLFISGHPEREGSWMILFSVNYWVFCLSYLFLFYGNTYVLVPRLYLQKQYITYFVIIGLLLLLTWYIKPFEQLLHRPHEAGRLPQPGDRPMDFNRPPPGRTPGPGGPVVDIVSVFLFITTIALGMAIQITKQWRQTLQQVTRAQADKATAELSFLKAQVNPHFLFNTLNNIYSLAVTKNDKTADSIMKLSNIMRYVTDDASGNEVSLQQEVDCITDYIELQRLRLSNKVSIEFAVEGSANEKTIAPLILMTFVENVFKYGISNHENATLTIKLFSTERSITLYTRNKIFNQPEASERTGIGISNTQKRLEYLYPGKHVLNISRENGFYSVELVLLA